MGHRGRANDVERLRVMRHMADVAALRTTPAEQRQLFIDGLDRLFNTTLGWFVVAEDARPDRPMRTAFATLTGSGDPSWVKYCADYAVHVPPSSDPYGDHFLHSDDVEQQWTLPRVMPDLAARRRYWQATDVMHGAKIGTGAVCGFRTGPGGDRLVAFSLHRCLGDPPLRERDYALHRFALTELRHLYDRGWFPLVEETDAAPAAPAVTALPVRQRQVFDRLLMGRKPKAIAHELGLSVWTVRDHVKRLYAHFAVNGRDELMAQFVDRPGDADP